MCHIYFLQIEREKEMFRDKLSGSVLPRDFISGCLSQLAGYWGAPDWGLVQVVDNGLVSLERWRNAGDPDSRGRGATSHVYAWA
ncbi:hypothetical protein FKM82_005066 [Ascaphus truei]